MQIKQNICLLLRVHRPPIVLNEFPGEEQIHEILGEAPRILVQVRIVNWVECRIQHSLKLCCSTIKLSIFGQEVVHLLHCVNREAGLMLRLSLLIYLAMVPTTDLISLQMENKCIWLRSTRSTRSDKDRIPSC